MALSEQELNPSYDKLLELIDKLPFEKQEQLRITLDRKANLKEWRELVDSIAVANKGLPPISDNEILAEIKATRQAKRAQIAKDSN